MTTKDFISKLMSRYLLMHLCLMMLVLAGVIVCTAFATAIYTHHGEAITVPDVKNKKISDARKLLTDLGLEVVITDTGYNRLLPPDCILQQSPADGLKVKSGRIIYLTVNSATKPSLTIPDIIDNSSMREATAKLRILGFKVGPPQYVPGEKDWVYGITCQGKSLVAGSKVPLDALVTLQVGNGSFGMEETLQVTDPAYTEPDHEYGPEEIDPFEEVTE